MTLGFHYHTSFILDNGVIKVPGQIGIFLAELARQCDTLYLFFEEARDNSSNDHDFALLPDNIVLIRTGYKSSFYKRLFWPGKSLDIIHSHIDKLDYMILRAPSPLMPLLFRKVHKKVPTWILIVGNYLNGISGLKQPFIRKVGIVLVLYIYNLLQLMAIRRARVFVNSQELFDTYVDDARHTVLIKTTTLQLNGFYQRTDTCQGPTIRILYTGRINFQKGLRELISAVGILKKKFLIQIDIVGWEDTGTFNFEEALRAQAVEAGIDSMVTFHGKKRVGEELNVYYRNSDIFVLATYHEGFPRTIWEAMANSLPIICTPVGGIPHELRNRQEAVFVPVKDSQALADAIEEVIVNKDLRQALIQHGYAKSKQNTVEAQTELLLNEMMKY